MRTVGIGAIVLRCAAQPARWSEQKAEEKDGTLYKTEETKFPKAILKGQGSKD